MLERRYDEAIAGDGRVAELDPGFSEAYAGMGRVDTQTGRFAEGEAMTAFGGSHASLRY